ncbi:hypothetical protein PARPLA_02061 [Rhodobacteraceae bacterium THAF1]|uniref:hypothetical protein n=1 Tax=Palleronia sp. THAF1 TaxID=2587842 RepID=UPI000F3CF4DC|nr:hypothetical protein [Palleronia sp. THAF1]QFU07774.1 hypothetical protein FIU81_03705 [Palleronia sp. THAF1]VDC25589.1 hypothetical protein PARPLA_02061 [Rhodobacteraceae bacterium THAF1]
MTDDQSETRARILAVAGQMGNPATPAEQTATSRGWLDADGTPTDDGRDMLEAMGEQTGTRSVFRG